MLEVGNGGQTTTEYQSLMSLWYPSYSHTHTDLSLSSSLLFRVAAPLTFQGDLGGASDCRQRPAQHDLGHPGNSDQLRSDRRTIPFAEDSIDGYFISQYYLIRFSAGRSGSSWSAGSPHLPERLPGNLGEVCSTHTHIQEKKDRERAEGMV